MGPISSHDSSRGDAGGKSKLLTSGKVRATEHGKKQAIEWPTAPGSLKLTSSNSLRERRKNPHKAYVESSKG